MYKDKRVLAVVPARGGSKGVPLKNLRMIGGKSLIAWVGGVAGKVPELDRVVVSTDHDGIAEQAEKHGISAPFRRPEELSGDRIGDIEVLQHALSEMEALDSMRYDVIVMLQPTSPSRESGHVSEAVQILVDRDCDAVWSVTETDLKMHPLKQLTVDETGSLGYYDANGGAIIARQQLQPVYHRNGIVYAIRRASLLSGVWLPENAYGMVIPGDVVNIDTEEDLVAAEKILGGAGA